MRIALFSDVHGNLPALQAVLDALPRHGPLDAVVCAGDMVYLGPHPAEVLDRLQAAGVHLLRGNADDLVTGALPIDSEVPPERPKLRAIHAAHVEWNRRQLRPERLEQLDRLPLTRRFSPAPGADLVVCHATPDDTNASHPFLGSQPPAELRRAYGGAGAAVAAFGHCHQPYVLPLGALTLVNVSCVSIPMDGLALANYTIAEWHGEHWSLRQHRVAYDLAPLVAAIAERAMPAPPWPRADG